MCELNYRGTKIKIGVKLGDQQKMKSLQGITQALTCHWHVAVTHGIDTWQSTSKVNGQRPNRAFYTNFAEIYKIGGPNLWIKL